MAAADASDPASAARPHSIRAARRARPGARPGRVQRRALLALLVTAGLAAAVTLVATSTDLVSSGGSAHGVARMTVTLEAASGGPQFADGAVGLSIEADDLATPDLSSGRHSLVALMRLLGPGVLRIGGNSLDSSWWTSSDEPPPTGETSVITPADLTRLAGLLRATGWTAILGVNLGYYDPARAADEAAVASSILGTSLLGFEVGNEPDLYGVSATGLRPSTYDAAAYLQELAAYVTAMRAAVPTMRLFGPDVSQPAWLPSIAAASTSIAVLTEHFYPTTYDVASASCDGTPTPSASDLLSPQVRASENAQLQTLTQIGAAAGLPTRISETNDTGSCDADGGPDTSPVYASALWALDWSLRAASAGVSGINFHGYLGECGLDAVDPLCASTLADELRGEISARPEYYGLLAARALEGGHFVHVDLDGDQAGDLSAYATIRPDRVITVAIVNFSSTQRFSIALRARGRELVTDEVLRAPSLLATHAVTLGGAEITANGAFRPAPSRLAIRRGSAHIRLGPSSAVIVTLR